MSNFERDHQHVARLRELARQPAAQALLQLAAPELPREMSDRLGRLRLLEHVPFHHLVVDERMLPEESLRFFYVDENWLDSLVDGAMSVATHSSSDEGYRLTMQPVIRRSADRAAQQVRSQLRDVPGPAAGAPPDTMTGLLLRSDLVSGCPGLEVRAFRGIDRDRKPAGPIEPRRLERLAPDVLLCLFAEVPGVIAIQEPPQGQGFGVTAKKVHLRGLGFGRHPAGVQIQDQTVTVDLRTGDKRVLDVKKTRDCVQQKLRDLEALESDKKLGPGGFALQLVKLAGQAVFEYRADGGGDGPALRVSGRAAVATEAPAFDEQIILDDLFARSS